jgi:hypothetical protein
LRNGSAAEIQFLYVLACLQEAKMCLKGVPWVSACSNLRTDGFWNRGLMSKFVVVFGNNLTIIVLVSLPYLHTTQQISHKSD